MKGKIKTRNRLLQDIDDESDLNIQNSSSKNKKQGLRVYTDKIAENWESDKALEAYIKNKTNAHSGRRQR